MAGARKYTDLTTWRLADELRVALLKLTQRERFKRDLKLQSQTEDAADSICRNIAEGFGCRTHPEFARFLEFSARSLNEMQDCLRSAELKGYVTIEETMPIRALARRLSPALKRLIAYLRRTPTPAPNNVKPPPRRAT